MIEYKFEEDRLLKELKEYIDKTYSEHYSRGGQGGIQVTEFIMSHLETSDFLRGNVLKYACRYGMKDGHNRKDILKILHYCLLLLCYHDRRYESKKPHSLVSPGVLTGEYKVTTEVDSGSWTGASNTPEVKICNVYVKMEGGKIGQEQNGKVVAVGYGDLDENGCLIPGTFRYSSEESPKWWRWDKHYGEDK